MKINFTFSKYDPPDDLEYKLESLKEWGCTDIHTDDSCFIHFINNFNEKDILKPGGYLMNIEGKCITFKNEDECIGALNMLSTLRKINII